MAFNQTNKGEFREYDVQEVKDHHDYLPAGYYAPNRVDGPFGPVFFYEKIEDSEKLVPVISESFERIINEIPEYFDPHSKAVHEAMGFSHKLGVLIYGPPGTGKTKAVEILIKKLVKYHKAIAINVTGLKPAFIVMFLKQLRKAHPTTLLVAFMDDAEVMIEHYESSFLAFLDGGDSVDNSIFIATTNFLNRIPDRIAKRPSRFKYVIEHSGLPLAAYHQFISEKMTPLTPIIPGIQEKVDELAEISFKNKYTLDFTKHLILDYAITGEIQHIDADILKGDAENDKHW